MDIALFNVDRLGPLCAFTVSGTCYGAPFTPTPLTLAECNAQKAALGITACSSNTDYWAGAVAQCGGVSKLPSNAQLSALANDLLGVSSCGGGYCPGTLNYTKSSSYGLPAFGTFFLWSSVEVDSVAAKSRDFQSLRSDWSNRVRTDWNPRASCLGD